MGNVKASRSSSRSASSASRDRLSATLALDQPVSVVPSVSPARAASLRKLGITTVRDLVEHYPRRYVDLSAQVAIAEASIGQLCTIRGRVHRITLKRPKPRLDIVEISLVDDTGLLMITCFRQRWLMESIHEGDLLAVAGKVEFNYGYKRMTNPTIEPLGEQRDTGAVLPVHPATEKLSAKMVRRLVANGLDIVRGLLDPLPVALREKYRLMSRGSALSCIQFPQSMNEVAQARRRLAYEELLLLELFLMTESKKRSEGHHPVAHVVDGAHTAALMAALPFTLTTEQEKARTEMLAALAKPSAANHMILGDVGTGKTVVAAFALAAAADSGSQGMLMAPTEVLALQHGKSLGGMLAQAGVSVAVLTGSTSTQERTQILGDFASGALDVLIGTHALLEDDVVGAAVSVVVIDEQQRFGVDQRARLLAKGDAPDAVYLTATPIPRTLALALFGNLTLSYITQRPHDLAHRTTKVLPRHNEGEAYEEARAALERGEQVYVVCPLVGTSTQQRDERSQATDEPDEGYHPLVAIEGDQDFVGDNAAAAEQEAQRLQEGIFHDWNVAVLHGQMPSADKQEIMERFRTGEINVLVATTVIEVGVDVPNATVMIIEDADRFGLSQLHQLRGRVGRGELSALVYLISASRQEAALARLQALETVDDGFELASYDLSLRREGDILGNRQSGASSLKLVNIVRDGAMVEAAHGDAVALLEQDPTLSLPEHQALAREMRLVFSKDSAVSGG